MNLWGNYMSENNDKGSILVLVGLVIVTTVNILDKLIELNEFVAVVLDLIALVCFIVYLVKFFRSKRYEE